MKRELFVWLFFIVFLRILSYSLCESAFCPKSGEKSFSKPEKRLNCKHFYEYLCVNMQISGSVSKWNYFLSIQVYIRGLSSQTEKVSREDMGQIKKLILQRLAEREEEDQCMEVPMTLSALILSITEKTPFWSNPLQGFWYCWGMLCFLFSILFSSFKCLCDFSKTDTRSSL